MVDSPEPIRDYVLYLRKSKGRAGIERQRKDCLAYASRVRGRVVETFEDEDTTAFSKVGEENAPRPDYERMLAYLRQDHRDPPLGILAWHADRLHRNSGEIRPFTAVCAKGGHLVETPRSGVYDLSTPNGRKRMRDDVSDAEHEVDHLIERVDSQKAEAAAEGRWLGGRRPFGYEADGVTVRPEEAALIAKGVDDVLVGVTLTQLARDWNAAGVTTSGGKRWRAEEVRRTLARARNAGIMVHRGEEVGSASWQAIVPEDRWRAVVALFSDPSRRTTPGPERRWLGSGLYRCGFPVAGQECGLVAKMGTAGNGPKLGRSTPAYRCSGPTRHVVRDAGNVDGYVENAIVDWLTRPEVAEILAPPERGDDSMELHMRALTLRTRIGEAGDMWEEGEITRAEYVKRKGRLQERLDQLNEQIAASVTVNAFEGLLGAEDVGAVWDGLPLSRRRAVLEELVTVTILPAPRGRPRGWQPGAPYFSPDHVRLDWKFAYRHVT